MAIVANLAGTAGLLAWADGISISIAILGAVLAFLSFFWKRKQKYLDSLSPILREYAKGLRLLVDANRQRRTAEQLKVSFPRGGNDGRPVDRVNECIEKYGELIGQSEPVCKNMEIELAANSFKFPNPIRRALDEGRRELFLLGQLVNKGQFDAADVQAVKVVGIQDKLSRMASGWQATNLFRLRSRKSIEKKLEAIREKSSVPKGKYCVSKERMGVVSDLIHRRLTTEVECSFAIHPPQHVVDNPQLLSGEVNPEDLGDHKFKVVFQNGTQETLSFVELMVLTYQLVFLAVQMGDIAEKLTKGGFGETTVQLNTTIDVPAIMAPGMVEVLLSKIELSPIPAEAV